MSQSRIAGIRPDELPEPDKASSRDSSLSSYSMDWVNATVLLAAVIAGAWLRLRDLSALDLSADEAPSWLAASASTVSEVLHTGMELNPGKLALHDLTLHFWMLAFGDGVTSIRALSALLGTLAIVLVFAVTRELFATEAEADNSAIAAFSALVFALNVVAIRYSREGRMYELMLVATLIQLWFFIRAVRQGRFVNYAGTLLFTVLAAATSFAADPVFLMEGLCLLGAMRPGATRWPHAWHVAVTLLAASAIVAALTPWRLLIEKASYFSWIGPGFLTDYVRGFFGVALQTPVLAVTLAFAIWGIVRGWNRYAEGVGFTLAWMFVPLFPLALFLGPIMLLLVTVYAWTPLFAHRGALSCIVPFCILAGLGIAELRLPAARLAAVALVVLLAGVRIHSSDPSSGDVEWGVQWRAATEAALPELKAGRAVNVVPGYGIYAVRYYSRNNHVDPALLTQDNRQAQVAILADTAKTLLHAAYVASHRYYPLELARMRGVSVLATPFAIGHPSPGR